MSVNEVIFDFVFVVEYEKIIARCLYSGKRTGKKKKKKQENNTLEGNPNGDDLILSINA